MPSELIVFTQLRFQHRAHVDETDRIFRRPLVVIGHCNADLAGIGIGIPKADDVKPRIQCGYEEKTDNDNPRGRHGYHSPYVSVERSHNGLHQRSSKRTAVHLPHGGHTALPREHASDQRRACLT